MVTVPNVRKMGLEAATKTLEQAGFKVAKKPVTGRDFLGLGYVSYTDPAAGEKARKGSTVTMYYV
ncbi:PASTA domain-containing protein [Microlunatus sp. Y2014]|uniref:PASTA domain-containing protein n=1 Tax=Microlunatus sp. Y2014 TaxID=3418488 RepID=UPI003DA6EF7D